jgi:hypothetical protein
MPEYDNTNRGTLFKNERKEQETHADYNGSVNIEGVEYYLNAWIKESKKDGSKFFSLSVKPKAQQTKPAQEKPKYQGRKQDEEGNEIPF